MIIAIFLMTVTVYASDFSVKMESAQEESEIISSNPHMFRCFMNIMDNDSVTKQMFDLFDFALGLCNKSKTQEYSRYLLAR